MSLPRRSSLRQGIRKGTDLSVLSFVNFDTFYDKSLSNEHLGEIPPQIDPNLGRALLLFCISIGNINWKKFLRWKLLDNICSSELEQNHQRKTYTCEFENFSDKFFPIFGRIETFQIMFVITSFVAKVTKVIVDAILRKKI